MPQSSLNSPDDLYVHILREQAESLEAECGRYRQALEFYADPDSYSAIGPRGTVKGAAWKIKEDGGSRAREALNG